MKTRKFNVYCKWNGYDQILEITLFDGEKANRETFVKEVRRLNQDDWELETIIYSWSLIEE